MDGKWLPKWSWNMWSRHVYWKKYSKYGAILRIYKSGDVVMLKFSLFQVSIEEENVGIAITHLESILCSAGCSITHWKVLLGDFETGSKILKWFFVGGGAGQRWHSNFVVISVAAYNSFLFSSFSLYQLFSLLRWYFSTVIWKLQATRKLKPFSWTS